MKRIIISLVLLSLIFFATSVSASSYNVSINGNSEFNEEITLTVQVNNFVDIDGACGGLCGLVGNLDYDKNKLSLESIIALNDFDLTQGATIVLFKGTGVASGSNVLQMKFKNIGLADKDTTTISFTNISASNGDSDITTTNASKTIKYVKPVVPAKTDTTNTNTTKPAANSVVLTKEVKSTNNYLKSISISTGEISFDKDILNYDLVVDSTVDEIKINGIVEDDKSTITGNNTYTLKEGSNVITLTVKAEDGTEKKYTINVQKDVEIIPDTVVTTTNNKSNKLLFIGGITCVVLVAISAFYLTKKKS